MSILTSKNPYTGKINATFETIDNDAIDIVIQQAHEAYLERKNTSFETRKQLFLKMADILDERNKEYALLETQEMGRLYTVAKKGLTSTANLIRRFANNAKAILKEEIIDSEGLSGYIQYDPIGVIYGIAPWNFPFNQLLRAAVPNILAGNTQIYKHASNVPLCAAAIQDLFDDAGFPKDVYTTLFTRASQSDHIIANDFIQGVNLTGGTPAGQAIGSLAGKYLKRSILELGGNDAFLLLDHSNTDKMVAEATTCRISNGGQRCNGSKRFVVLEKYYDTFVEKFGAYMGALKTGDPMDLETQVPPMASAKLVNEIHRQVTETIKQGARCITGGTILDAEKNLYAPTVLADVTPEMTSYNEEVFGPVASVIKAKNIDDAIAIANNNDFGLSAVVYGDDKEQCKLVAKKLEGGMIFINQPAGSKASLPFGGVKKSGYGKENGPDGLKAFTNKKVILW